MANNKTADDKTLQTYPSPDGKRWIELRQRPDGMFYFQEFYEASPDDSRIWTRRNYTTPGFASGLYESFEAAESDLIKMTPWLCAKAK